MSCSISQSITFVFVTIFRFLKRRNLNRVVGPAQQNPHPFGTRQWKQFADAQATCHEQNVLRIADLEAQVNQTTELAEALQEMADFQASIISDLRLQNKALLNGPDPEVMERILDRLHTPIKKPDQVPGPQLQSTEQERSGPSHAPAKRRGPSSGKPGDVSGATVPSGASAHSRPLTRRTLAQELEAQLEDESEDESETGNI
ncbi:hypothetical protein Daus18300_008616 [Diaporthe australafricana]|uniref:Uncharacterized protein n=1 Tax=Diaporthe australafricana TaxID=127596 RepID=A0ABR3WHS8_9PEZI